ncbi:MAG: hypothetical protein EPO01_00710 [Aquabacterium sp.]|nr:MAG: hypothetical protein EPO01_00710 [Aquabacterium sp.]
MEQLFRARTALVAYAMLASVATQASPATQEAKALARTDKAAALRTLQRADKLHDREASGLLVEWLYTWPAPWGQRDKACELAARGPAWGDATSRAVRTLCRLSAGPLNEEQVEQARGELRAAHASGSMFAAATLWWLFQNDPQWRDRNARGEVDPRRRARLAATPLTQRQPQIEALEALGEAVAAGNPSGIGMAATVLATTSAPGNNERLVKLAAEHAALVPARLKQWVSAAQRLQALGPTRVSPQAAVEVGLQARRAASAVAASAQAGACRDLHLSRIEAAGAPREEVYLPVQGVFDDSYLVQGSWDETWVYEGCDKAVAVSLTLKADGWGGVGSEVRGANVLQPLPRLGAPGPGVSLPAAAPAAGPRPGAS